ncbi:DUF2628 domain-containing protein [Alkalibacillus haloalkaliphilus]|uniref:DUF2628 domain-containing protein n=1 Tax=Alkalibacillus haloalkaliphilus TaxID=94136 RepID=UPI002935D1F9|nr:DUF2628 domain-containing protein [Alkalibacillus haloalkaliphilus]MDV2583034.1 DUF2628 domain-containing protein [Alkalibacillus haloalkaliphilus]
MINGDSNEKDRILEEEDTKVYDRRAIEEELEKKHDELTSDYIGRNDEYYKDKFNKFKQKDTKLSFNFVAFFIDIYWLVYRKMYGLAAGLYIGFLAFGIILMFVTDLMGLGLANDTIIFIVGILFVLSKVLLGMFGNYLYMKKVEKNISLITRYTAEEKEQHKKARTKGGTSIVAIFITFIILFTFNGTMAFIGKNSDGTFDFENMSAIEIVQVTTVSETDTTPLEHALDNQFNQSEWESYPFDEEWVEVVYTGTGWDQEDHVDEVEIIFDVNTETYEVWYYQISLDGTPLAQEELEHMYFEIFN